MTLQVGQQLWYVPNKRPGQPYFVTVLKVGRKWAEIGHRRRISIEGLFVDGGQYSSPGRCYLSKEDHEKEVALNSAWARFMEMARYANRPEGVRLSQIENAARSLFGKSVLPASPVADGGKL